MIRKRMTMRAHIIYYNYLKPDGEGMSIGGVQTYITNLVPLLKRCGYDVSIYQRGDIDFHKVTAEAEVYGVKHNPLQWTKLKHALLDKALKHIDCTHDLLVYGCETCIVRSVPCRTIAIQHGIMWDVPYPPIRSRLMFLRRYIGKVLNAWRTSKRVGMADCLVCVDHNFVNWHRAVMPYFRNRHYVIPNFSMVPDVIPEKGRDVVRIIFARRFVPHRGTRLFADVVEKVLTEYPNVHVTVAGSGPDGDMLHQRLDMFNNVLFVTYRSDESLSIHKDKDIAVIPTIGSEGTSLSLLEAMASGCAPICTNVGGMTNIVLDGYNGIMIDPNVDDMYHALKTLIEDATLRCMIQKRAYETVSESFSLRKWQDSWMKILKE